MMVVVVLLWSGPSMLVTATREDIFDLTACRQAPGAGGMRRAASSRTVPCCDAGPVTQQPAAT